MGQLYLLYCNLPRKNSILGHPIKCLVTWPKNSMYMYWLCKCQCHTTKFFHTANFTKKIAIFCPCSQHEGHNTVISRVTWPFFEKVALVGFEKHLQEHGGIAERAQLAEQYTYTVESGRHVYIAWPARGIKSFAAQEALKIAWQTVSGFYGCLPLGRFSVFFCERALWFAFLGAKWRNRGRIVVVREGDFLWFFME